MSDKKTEAKQQIQKLTRIEKRHLYQEGINIPTPEINNVKNPFAASNNKKHTEEKNGHDPVK